MARPFEEGAERARIIARHHDRRLGSILQVVRHEAHTADEITEEIFGSTLLNFERRLALGEALAHIALPVASEARSSASRVTTGPSATRRRSGSGSKKIDD